MVHTAQLSPRAFGLLTAAAVLLGSFVALADGLTGQIAPSYNYTTTDATDETGRVSRSSTSQLLQKYRLTLDQSLFPLVRFSAGGNLEWVLGGIASEGARAAIDQQRWAAYARLRAGSPFLSAGFDVDRGTQSGAGSIVHENLAASVAWRPSELPSLDVRVNRTNAFEPSRKTFDMTTDEAMAATLYRPTHQLELRSSVRASSPYDRVNDVRSTDLSAGGAVAWSDRFLGDRGTAYAGYSLSARSSEVVSRGGKGTVATQQLPTGGLSIVETFPALPAQVTLNPNSSLIDGNTTASAGLNLGYSASLGGDLAYRDLGAQFADTITPVNAVYVWVDRQLPVEVVNAFSFSAYRSDDNLNWTEVTITAAPLFGQAQNRIEISIEETQARYLKVVTRPLAAAVTVDSQYSEIFVTEVQWYMIVPAERARGHTTAFSGVLNGSARLLLLRRPSLAYDVGAMVTHATTSLGTLFTYSVVNGLSTNHAFSSKLTVSARVDRSDSDGGHGHESLNRWSAGLSYNPLPTLGFAASYGGQYQQMLAGGLLSNGLSLLGRADVYQGIAVAMNGSVSQSHDSQGRDLRGLQAGATTSLVPNKYVSLNASGMMTLSQRLNGPSAGATERRGTVDAGAALSPFPSLAVAASVSRTYSMVRPVTLANFSGSFSPFQGGALSVRYVYSEGVDTTGAQRTRSHGPSARWNIRPGWHLDASYTFLDSYSPSQSINIRAFSSNLLISLR